MKLQLWMICAVLFLALSACEKSSLFIGNDEFVIVSYETLSRPEVTLLDRSQFITFNIDALTAFEPATGASGVAMDDIRIVDRKNRMRSIAGISIEECPQLDCRNNEWEQVFVGSEAGFALDNNIMAILVIDLNATLGLDGAKTKQTIKAFIEDLYSISTETLIGIVAYNDKVRTLGLRTFEEQNEVYQFIDGLSTAGTYSGMYESCLRAIDILNGTVFRGAKNLILFTDEGDETSIGAILKEEVQTARIARRVVALDGTLFTDKDDQEMEELAQSAENYRLAGDQTGLANAFTDFAEQMRQTDGFVFERPGDFVDRPRLIRFTFNLR